MVTFASLHKLISGTSPQPRSEPLFSVGVWGVDLNVYGGGRRGNICVSTFSNLVFSGFLDPVIMYLLGKLYSRLSNEVFLRIPRWNGLWNEMNEWMNEWIKKWIRIYVGSMIIATYKAKRGKCIFASHLASW